MRLEWGMTSSILHFSILLFVSSVLNFPSSPRIVMIMSCAFILVSLSQYQICCGSNLWLQSLSKSIRTLKKVLLICITKLYGAHMISTYAFSILQRTYWLQFELCNFIILTNFGFPKMLAAILNICYNNGNNLMLVSYWALMMVTKWPTTRNLTLIGPVMPKAYIPIVYHFVWMK